MRKLAIMWEKCLAHVNNNINISGILFLRCCGILIKQLVRIWLPVWVAWFFHEHLGDFKKTISLLCASGSTLYKNVADYLEQCSAYVLVLYEICYYRYYYPRYNFYLDLVYFSWGLNEFIHKVLKIMFWCVLSV